MVLPWMNNGNVNQYIQRKVEKVNLVGPEYCATVNKLVSFHNLWFVTHQSVNWIYQLMQISSGLTYLHSECIIHGDLRGVSYPLLLKSALYTFIIGQCSHWWWWMRSFDGLWTLHLFGDEFIFIPPHRCFGMAGPWIIWPRAVWNEISAIDAYVRRIFFRDCLRGGETLSACQCSNYSPGRC